MTTALDIIKGALERIQSYSPSDPALSNEDANTGLTALNDLLDELSIQHNALYGSIENILYYTGGVYEYLIGIGSTLAATATQGAFEVQRPLRITNAFTRITTQGTGYDYQIEIISQDRYVEFGLKSIPYPWPTHLWYNNAYPFGIINFYGQPNGGGELHLFTDTVLANLTLTQTVVMPQGYSVALKWLLARELASIFGFPVTQIMEQRVKESWGRIKALNADPVPESRIDCEIQGGRADAGFILTGGYR